MKKTGVVCLLSILLSSTFTGVALAHEAMPGMEGQGTVEGAEGEEHRFDGGSGLMLHDLSAVQIESLTRLGKIWGFLKYHHPQVVSGNRQWDYDLFDALPAVLAAANRAEANTAILLWIAELGEIAECDPCADLSETDLYLRPRLQWLNDEASLGTALSRTLRAVYRARIPGEQFYVSIKRNVGNPLFRNELAYADIRFPDAGLQLLALYRFWNIIEYWFPYRNVMDEDWDGTLAAFIPGIALADSKDTYQRELMALIARAHDSHSNLWSSLHVRPPVGECQLPVGIRFIGREAVVSRIAPEFDGWNALQRGDVIESIDGTALDELIDEWAPYYAASNEAVRLRDIARYMTRGECGTMHMGIRRAGKTARIKAHRVPAKAVDASYVASNDLPGATFRLLSERAAYLKLSTVMASKVADYVRAAAGTDGLIIDIRNYPSDFVVFALGSLLVETETAFARFVTADISNPGAFHWASTVSVQPGSTRYVGKVIILVDELSMSMAEYTAMALRVAPQAVVVGSATTGADGNLSRFVLPGGLGSAISGIGVFYPDKTPTQRIGIVPDVPVTPTVAGIGEGRDEVLEVALRQIFGAKITAEQLRRLYGDVR